MDPKTILIIGSGGREHALAWRCHREGHRVLAVPGSDAIAAVATCHLLAPDDHEAIVDFTRDASVDLVVVGPEQPLVEGLADRLRAQGFAVFGPGRDAARLEGSKADAKAFMERWNIPTARAVVVETLDQGLRALDQFDELPVVKADGLAAGKGVTVPDSREEAVEALRTCFEARKFGVAGERVVLEERLRGQELSVFAITDGTHAMFLAPVRDHKRLIDGGRGPNTGGMGAFTPVPDLPADLMRQVRETIVAPTLAGLRAEGRPYQGVLFLGLMMDARGEARVIEYNCRFGDPEIQPLVFGMEGELVPLLWAAAHGELDDGEVAQRPAVVVVLASAGYPDSPQVGNPIEGLDQVASEPDLTVFHAGTRRTDQGWVSAGGRVLGLCARGTSVGDAVARAYRGLDRIRLAGGQARRDIGRGLG